MALERDFRRTTKNRFFGMLRSYELAEGIGLADEREGPDGQTHYFNGEQKIGYRAPGKGYLRDPSYWVLKAIHEKYAR